MNLKRMMGTGGLTTFNLSVNSVGGSVNVTSTPSGYSGNTNYNILGIPFKTQITLTTATKTLNNLDFNGWNFSVGFGVFPRGLTFTMDSNITVTADYISITSNHSSDVLATSSNSLYVPYAVYPLSSSGFAGPRFSQPSVMDDFTAGKSVIFSPDKNVIVYEQSSNIVAYKWSSTGFGTKYSGSLLGGTNDVNALAFHPSGNALARVGVASPYVRVVEWNNISGVGQLFSSPSILPSSSANCVTWNKSGSCIAVAHNRSGVSTNISVYSWIDQPRSSGGGFGSKYSNPSPIPPGNVLGVSFNNAGTAIAVAHTNSPFISVYEWSDATGFGAKYPNPSILPPASGRYVTFNPNDTSIAVAHDNAPGVSVYQWSNSTGFGSRYPNPSPAPTGSSRTVKFNSTGTVIAFAATSIDGFGLFVYPWSNSTGFGSRYSNPPNVLNIGAGGLAFKD
jgi:hypothetical protein